MHVLEKSVGQFGCSFRLVPNFKACFVHSWMYRGADWNAKIGIFCFNLCFYTVREWGKVKISKRFLGRDKICCSLVSWWINKKVSLEFLVALLQVLSSGLLKVLKWCTVFLWPKIVRFKSITVYVRKIVMFVHIVSYYKCMLVSFE